MEVSEAPKSALEAFENNGIPAVRAFEKQLQSGILRDKERLRALVGGNYRDLLSTADEITTLNEKNRRAETQISDLSQQCKPPQLLHTKRPIPADSSTSAQLRLLTQCLAYASKTLQTRSVLLCAKITVISRLLLKSLGEQQPAPETLVHLRGKVTAIRSRLLRVIDVQFSHPLSDTEVLVHDICAYCLLTSASSVDAVKHFRSVRLERLRSRLQDVPKDQRQITESFRYLVSSVRLLKSLLGRPVNDALAHLQRQPILQDQSILRMEALDVDRLQILIPNDILTFTPYVKRVLLKQDEIQQTSTEWVKQACRVYSKGLQDVLATIHSVSDIFALRRVLLSMILPVYFSTYAHEEILETVRQTTGGCILNLCRAQVEGLISTANSMVSNKAPSFEGSSLWNDALAQKSLTSKGTHFARRIRMDHLGTRGELTQSVKRVNLWAKQVAQLRIQFQALESIRWQDLLEEPDDDDEESAEVVTSQLSKDDPRQFRSALEQSLKDAVSNFRQALHDASVEITEATDDGKQPERAARIVYLLRAVRESSTILTSATPDVQLETKDLTSRLHDSLADCISQEVLSSIKSDSSASLIDNSLSEDMPTPQTIKLLRNVCRTMADVGGTDIWSSAAVSHLKHRLQIDLLERDEQVIYFSTDFDKAYMRAALSDQQESPAKGMDLSDTDIKARAYWQRTKLLFGALS